MRDLADLYGLSPATMAGLAQIQGQPNPTATPALDAVSEYVPQATGAAVEANPLAAQAKEILGTKPVQDISQKAESIGRAFAPALGPAGWFIKPAPPDASAAAAAPDTTPQGPATDGFPTVRTDYGGSGAVANGQALPVGPTVPAHWSHSTSKDGREGYELDPMALESMGVAHDAAAGHGLLAADHRHQAATMEAEADAQYAMAKQRALRIGAEDQAALQQARQSYVNDHLKTLQNLATEAKAKINPNEIWQGAGGGVARVMAALAIGLGQFGAMMRGGPNAALQIVQNQIDANIDAQKQKIGNAKDAYHLQSNLYAQNLQAFGDKERAILATKMNYLDQVQNMLDMKKAEAKGHIADASYEDMTAAVLNAKAAHEKEFLELTKVKSTQELTDKWKDATTPGLGGDKGKDPLYVPTMGGYARDAETARALNTKGALRMQMTENMHQIYQLMDKAKGMNSATSPLELRDIEQRIEALKNDTLTKNTVLEGQGAMSKDDKAVAEAAKSLGNLGVQGVPNSMIARKQAQVRDAATRVLEAHRLDSEAHGIQVGREVYQQGAHGLEPKRVLEGRNKTVSKNTEAVDDLVSPPKGVPQK